MAISTEANLRGALGVMGHVHLYDKGAFLMASFSACDFRCFMLRTRLHGSVGDKGGGGRGGGGCRGKGRPLDAVRQTRLTAAPLAATIRETTCPLSPP